MNLYDEAMKELQDYINEYGMDYYGTKHYPVTIKALTRAKKEHELLGLYKERSTFVFMPDCNYKDMSIKSLDFKIKQLEEVVE